MIPTTAAKRGRRKQQIADDRALLVRRFPLCFMPKGDPKLPLKVDIHLDVIAASIGIPEGRIYRALHDYMRGRTYVSAMLVVGSPRIDLTGRAVGHVTARAARHYARVQAAAAESYRQYLAWCEPQAQAPVEAKEAA